jgi:hypothetical protein
MENPGGSNGHGAASRGRRDAFSVGQERYDMVDDPGSEERAGQAVPD